MRRPALPGRARENHESFSAQVEKIFPSAIRRRQKAFRIKYLDLAGGGMSIAYNLHSAPGGACWLLYAAAGLDSTFDIRHRYPNSMSDV